MFAADMKLPERILRDPGEAQHRLVKRRVLALRLGIETVGADRVTRRTETRHDLLTRDVELLTLDDHAFRFCAGGRRAWTGRCRGGVLTRGDVSHKRNCDGEAQKFFQ